MIKIGSELLESFRKKYSFVHPLVFHRSLEKAESPVDLFDILESIPNCPFFWDDTKKRWTKTLDFYCVEKAKIIAKKG